MEKPRPQSVLLMMPRPTGRDEEVDVARAGFEDDASELASRVVPAGTLNGA
jgi:hypothetical protein